MKYSFRKKLSQKGEYLRICCPKITLEGTNNFSGDPHSEPTLDDTPHSRVFILPTVSM